MPSFDHYTTLAFDALCYHAAKTNYEAAEKCIPQIQRARSGFNNLLQQEIALLAMFKDDPSASYDEHEPLAIMMEGAEFDINSAYGPFLQYLASTHILCETCAEAHINIKARESLAEIDYPEFERKRIKDKWWLLPKLLRLEGFDRGAEPFQGFSRLVYYRNELVHYKSEKEEWNREGGVPSFIEKLGLTLTAGKASLNAVKGIITALARDMGQDIPHWLTTDDLGYFESSFILYP